MADILNILNHLGLQNATPTPFTQAAFSSVYDVGDYVLRAQKIDETSFLQQHTLMQQAENLTQLRMPVLSCLRDKGYLQQEDMIWYLYKKITGTTPCTWHNWEKAPESKIKQTFQSLRALHEATGRKLNAAQDNTLLSPFHYATKAFKTAKSLLSHNAMHQIEVSLQRAALWHDALTPKDFCFVHGDWHPGNILWHNDEVFGCVDMDFCHVGHPFEDLGFTLMMLMRDCRNDAFTLHTALFEKYIQLYGVERPENLKILHDLILLFAVFDIGFFKENDTSHYLARQLDYTEALCKWVSQK